MERSFLSNRFNYMTGRWVQITGLWYKPELDQNTWLDDSSPDYRRRCGFECDLPFVE